MNLIRTAIDGAVAAAMAEHPKYFTDKGHEHAQIVIVRKIMAALRGDGEKSDASEDAKPAPTGPITVDPTGRMGRAYLVLCQAAGAVAPFRTADGKFSVRPEAQGDDVLAFADAPPASAWLFIHERQKIGAWTEFFREVLPGVARRPIAVTQGEATGILAPWPWPPASTGKTYDPTEDAA